MKTMLVLSLLFPFCLSAQPWNVAKRFSATTGSTVTNNAIAALPDGSAYLVGSLVVVALLEGGFTLARAHHDAAVLRRLGRQARSRAAAATPA